MSGEGYIIQIRIEGRFISEQRLFDPNCSSSVLYSKAGCTKSFRIFASIGFYASPQNTSAIFRIDSSTSLCDVGRKPPAADCRSSKPVQFLRAGECETYVESIKGDVILRRKNGSGKAMAADTACAGRRPSAVKRGLSEIYSPLVILMLSRYQRKAFELGHWLSALRIVILVSGVTLTSLRSTSTLYHLYAPFVSG